MTARGKRDPAAERGRFPPARLRALRGLGLPDSGHLAWGRLALCHRVSGRLASGHSVSRHSVSGYLLSGYFFWGFVTYRCTFIPMLLGRSGS